MRDGWLLYLLDVLVSRVVAFVLDRAEAAHDMVGVIGMQLFDLNLVVKMVLKGLEVEVAVLAVLVVGLSYIVAPQSGLGLEPLVAATGSTCHKLCHVVGENKVKFHVWRVEGEEKSW